MTNTIDTARAKRMQQALLSVPGAAALMPSGADGILGSEFDRTLDLVVMAAGGVMPAPSAPSGELPEGYLALLSRIESEDRLYVKAASSSASGLYQFIRTTWLGEGGNWGPDRALAFGGLRPSKAEQDQRATSFTLGNARALTSARIPINRASLYAAHFLGAPTALRVLDPDQSVQARVDVLAGPDATAANPSVLKGKTVGQFLTWLHGKTGEWAR